MTTEQKLEKQAKKQKETIASLTRRINELVDRLAIVEEDINNFKKRVANDIQHVIKLYEISQRGG